MKRTTGGRVGYESVNVSVRRNDPSSNGVSAICQRHPGGVGRQCVKGGELQSVSLHIESQLSTMSSDLDVTVIPGLSAWKEGRKRPWV